MFVINGEAWRTKVVSPKDDALIDRTNTFRVATTDSSTHCVYLSRELSGDFLTRVFLHELGHCVMISYNLVDELHEMVKPKYWLEAEEWLCNFIADYGRLIFDIARQTFGEQAITLVPEYLDKAIA